MPYLLRPNSVPKLALVSICTEALISSCSEMNMKDRIIVTTTMLFVGLFFLFVYFIFWTYFIMTTEKHLRENSDFSNFGSGLQTPKSYNTFDKMDYHGENEPIAESIV